ncbi:DUF5989 family protein [bacterium]|nr:DUF5989 family protein [bacterium]
MKLKDLIEGVKQLLRYMMQRKKLWLLPIISALILVSALLIIGESSGVGSLVYVLF